MKKYFYSIVLILFILFGGAYLLYQYNILDSYNTEVLELKEKIAKANSEQEELKNQMEYQTSVEYIEKLAREQLGMVKSDEIIFYDRNN